MGAFLDKPKTEKLTAKGEGKGIRYGVSAMQGWRMEMEDAHTCVTSLPFIADSSFFGVFDGHAGPKAAEYCSNNLLNTIVKCYEADKSTTAVDDRITSAIIEGFKKLDECMLREPSWRDGKDRSGTTAVVTVITPESIFLGNCGDSRGILCRDGQVHFATCDHKPFNEGERARIEKAGGTVMMQRVNGSLAVSRALGDFDYKRSSNLPATDQLVSPEPDITVNERDPARDQFLLLACDGIFDVMSNDEVVAYVLRQLPLHENPVEICSSLIDMCLNKNSRDNMSVILVVFPGAPEFSREALEKEEEALKQFKKESESALKKMVEEATDPLELEENQVLIDLQKVIPESAYVYSRRPEIVESLAQLRKEKFGEAEDFSSDLSDPADPPREFVEMMARESLDEQVQPSSLDSTGQPVQTPTVDSDTTTMEGINSTTNKTIM